MGMSPMTRTSTSDVGGRVAGHFVAARQPLAPPFSRIEFVHEFTRH
jgi:hypothetical protein